MNSSVVAFSGHRSDKLLGGVNESVLEIVELKKVLIGKINNLIEKGYDTFLTGMADGFDLIASECVLDIKATNNQIKLHCIIPFTGHIDTINPNFIETYNNVINNSDKVITLNEKQTHGSYYSRNRYLVDNSNRLVCYYDGTASGTEYTIEYAKKKKVHVDNISKDVPRAYKMPLTIDNKRGKKVHDIFRENMRMDSKLSIISAYFTIYAYAELKNELSRIDSMRFIFTEPTFVNKDDEMLREYYLSKDSERNLSGNSFEIKLRNEMKQAHIAKECAKWLQEKVEIKSLKRPNPAQPRFIHIEHDFDDTLINGTVDFSSDGLGLTSSNRVDTNMVMYGKPATQGFLMSFNELWNNAEAVQDVKDEVLEHMQVLYKENTPEFIYFITLYNIFSNYLDELTEENIVKSKTGVKDTKIWNMLYKFQADGVLGAIDKLEKYNGCILADSVGLGKTFSALAVIKYYELRNDRVLVLAPKKLRENWTVYTQNDKRNLLANDRFNYDVLNHTDLSRYSGYSGEINLETINWSNYDLIVIDESHNFRNNEAKKDKETRYSRLLNKVIKCGVKTKILMLSATPVNNRMNDIKNQIAFITEGDDKALEKEGIISIEQTLRKAQLVFNKWLELPDEERKVDEFVEMMNMDYFKLLDIITIARSRKHIEKYYDTSAIGKFPTRNIPKNIKADIDAKGEFPPLKEINKTIRNLNMSSYSPLKYVLPEKKAEYSKKYDMQVAGGKSVFKQTDREQSLVNLMRVNILKRMESSIYSFGLTVSKLLQEIDRLIAKIDSEQFGFEENMSITDIDIEDDQLSDMLIGNKVKVLMQDMDTIKWRQDLKDDRDRLEQLLVASAMVTENRDAKLIELKKLIDEKIENPINDGNKKVIVFTAFADTAEYLYKTISSYILEKHGLYSAIVTGSGNNKTTLKTLKIKDLNSILTNFSPRSKERDKIYSEITDDIDVLIATDCISEGQNLQDCDYLINYDIHWNPVRIIQRFGRIDRLGSTNDRIQLVNFWANMELDEYINLEARVMGRMVLLDISATGEENVIETNHSKKMNDLAYRKKQLEQLQKEVVDLEDIAGGISITDMTLNDFKMDLMEYMKTNRKQLENAPMGMYAIATSQDESLSKEINSGVIFTLKQVNKNVRPEENNSLYPYYMVYVEDDGTVRYNYLHTKQILDFYKKLCSGTDEVYHDLVEIFNDKTDFGNKMDEYTGLLEQSIQNIIGKSEEKGVASLFSKGGTTLQKDMFSGLEDFELVSFLIIKLEE